MIQGCSASLQKKRLAIAADGVRFLNVKLDDPRFHIEDDLACSGGCSKREEGSKRCVEVPVYTDKVNKVLKKLKSL